MSFAPYNNFVNGGYTNHNATLTRLLATANGAALSTGVMTSVSMFLPAGLTVRNIGFVSATVAAVAPTHWAYAMYSTAGTPAVLGSTADQTNTAFGANTYLPKPLATPVVTTKSGIYWFSFWMAATTVPTLLSAPALTAGLLNVGGINAYAAAAEKALAVTSGAALVATPATIASPTNSLVVPLCYVS